MQCNSELGFVADGGDCVCEDSLYRVPSRGRCVCDGGRLLADNGRGTCVCDGARADTGAGQCVAVDGDAVCARNRGEDVCAAGEAQLLLDDGTELCVRYAETRAARTAEVRLVHAGASVVDASQVGGVYAVLRLEESGRFVYSATLECRSGACPVGTGAIEWATVGDGTICEVRTFFTVEKNMFFYKIIFPLN